MKLSKKDLARQIDRLADIKIRIATLRVDEEALATQVKRAGGGQSDLWLAKVIVMPKHTCVIPRHKQLRMFVRELGTGAQA